jgi:hypothetical protein
MLRRIAQVISLGMLLAAVACTVAPPYDEVIDNGAQALRSDFLKFVSERQQQMGTDQGTYAKNTSAYSGFQAQLGAIQLRAADQPNGVNCKRLTDMFVRVHTGISSFNTADISAAASSPNESSCIVVLAQIAARQLRRLQENDKRRCSTPASVSCTELFGKESIATMVAAVHAPEPANAAASSPLVRAVLVSIDELASAEQDLKAAAGQ